MKKTAPFVLRALAVCLCALMLLPLFAACNNDGTGDGTSDAVTTAPEAVSFPALWEGSTVNYRTVRPDEGTAAEQEAAMEISSALRKYSGGNPEIGTDFVMPGEEHSSESFEILVGQTSYPESRQVAAETGYGGYAVRTVGHKIVVFGWNDTSLATAVRRFTDLLEGGAEFAQPIAITGSVSETLDAIPTFEGANKVIIYSVGDKAYENVIEKSSAEAFASYCARLAEAGFEMTFDRTENSNNFAQYKKGDVGVTVYFTAFNNTVRIISEPASNMSDRSADTATVEKKCDARLTMIGRTFSKTGSYRGVPVNCGLMCFVLRLENGSFIVIDGGVATEGFAAGIMDTMKSQAPDPSHIHIAAWIITHTHSDHTGGFNKFSETYGRRVTLDELILNFPSEDTCDASPDHELNNRKKTLNNFKVYYPKAKLTKIHTGETRNIGGAGVEFLYTPEDYYTSKRTFADTKLWNNTSLIFRVTIAGQKLMFLGDSQVDSNGIAVKMWGGYLKSDICQVAHHGGEGGTAAVYNAIDPTVALFTTSDEAFELYKKDAHNAHLLRKLHVKEVINCACRITEFPLPYTPGNSAVTDKGNVY